MWKDYSASYIRNNRASSMSIMVAAFISALFLSLLCSLFYNFWAYEVDGIVLEEGDWQGRIVGQLSDKDLDTIRGFANVKTVVADERLSDGQKTTADITFRNPRAIYRDLPLILEQLGMEESAASYHALLLSRYLIHDPQDREPPLLMAFYLIVLLLVSASLILIIHNSFAVSMNARIHQFGILSSIGATPGQIRACLIQEAAALCALPLLLGSLLGIALGYGLIQATNLYAAGIAGRHEAVFHYQPMVFAVTIFSSSLTVLLSAWLPARKLSRLSPLEAIRNTDGLTLRKKRRSRMLTLLFGIEGELAGNALKAQKKALRTSALSLTLSFLSFTLMLCFFTLSEISTDNTYFEKYQDVWDVMIAVKNTDIADFALTEELRGLDGMRDCVVYQKAEAIGTVSKAAQSDELASVGGLEAVAGASVPKKDGAWLIKTPLMILDDGAFAAYCGQIGATAETDGAIVLNRIWNSLASNFRYKEFILYVKENGGRIELQSTGQGGGIADIKVQGYARQEPALREEYDNYALPLVLPLSLWKSLSPQIGNAEADTYIRVLAREGAPLEELNELEAGISQLLERRYTIESENRMQEKLANDQMLMGFQLLLGGLCILLALIGVANVFSNTLGFLRQRRREFAEYMSIGMSPAELRKMLCIEALVIASRPLLVVLPLTALAVGFMISASYLNPMEFIARAPLLPMAAFIAGVFGFVALAYTIGGRRVLRCNLMNALRDDTMV